MKYALWLKMRKSFNTMWKGKRPKCLMCGTEFKPDFMNHIDTEPTEEELYKYALKNANKDYAEWGKDSIENDFESGYKDYDDFIEQRVQKEINLSKYSFRRTDYQSLRGWGLNANNHFCTATCAIDYAEHEVTKKEYQRRANKEEE